MTPTATDVSRCPRRIGTRYVKTVADTARTIAGTQHPAYAYRITGRGDLALADLRGARAALVFPPGGGGDYLIVDAKRGEVVAEVFKASADRRRVAVPSGAYLVGRKEGGQFLAARFDARAGGEVVVGSESALRPTPLVLGRTKGRADVYPEPRHRIRRRGRCARQLDLLERGRARLSPETGRALAGGSARRLRDRRRQQSGPRLSISGGGPRAGAAAERSRWAAWDPAGRNRRWRLRPPAPSSGETSSGLVGRLAGVLGLDVPLGSRFSATSTGRWGARSCTSTMNGPRAPSCAQIWE